jgi:predicted acetyltransferase
MRLVRPSPAHLPSYVAALERGWSPDNTRGAAATQEQLGQIASDPDAFFALMDDPLGAGPPVTLPDGTQRARIPGLRRWMWEDADGAEGGASGVSGESGEAGEGGFIGSIGLRWMPGNAPLPLHVLGHIGYTVVPWKQRRGHATRALALMLEVARRHGLPRVQITTDPDNLASQKVITANGGVLVETFDKGEAYGHVPGLRYVIELG